MPWRPYDDQSIFLQSPTGQPIEPDKPRPAVGDIFSAAFDRENLVYNLGRKLYRDRNPVVPGYNPIDDDRVKGTRYETQYLDKFTDAYSPADTERIIADINREEQDAETLSAGGAIGLGAAAMAGILDPTIFLPGGAIYRTSKGGYSLVRSALSMSTAAAGQVAVQEAGLQASQQTRTAGESIINIGTGALLGAIIGTGAAKLLSRTERKALEESLAAHRDAIGGMKAGGAAPADVRSGELQSFVPQAVSRAYEKVRATARKVPYIGGAIDTAIGLPEKIALKGNPLMRLATSENIASRRNVADIASLPLETVDNLEGIVTSKFGIPLDLDVKMTLHEAETEIYDTTQKLFSDYRYSDQVRFPAARAYVEKKFGRSDGMTFDEFMTEVDTALRNKDRHEIPQVEAAAKIFRKWLDAAKDMANRLGWDIGDDVLGADSFAPRLYDKAAIARDRPGFVRRYIKWRSGDQAQKLALRDTLEREWSIMMGARAAKRRAEGKLDTADRLIRTAEARLGERKIEATAAMTRQMRASERAKAAADAVAEMKQFIDNLKEVGDTAEIKAQIADLESGIRDIEDAAKPISMDDLEAIDKAETDGILVGPMRRVARILTGKSRNVPDPPVFWRWVRDHGGIKDDGGDVSQMVGKKNAPGLFKKDGLQWDDLQTVLMQEFPELRVRWERAGLAEDFGDDIRQAIVGSVDGDQPEWFLDQKWSSDDRLVYEWVTALDQAADEAGLKFKTMADVADMIQGRVSDGIGEADFDKMIASVEESGAGVASYLAADDLQQRVKIRRTTIEMIKSTLDQAKKKYIALKGNLTTAIAVNKEAAASSTRNLGRLGILNERALKAAAYKDVLEKARAAADFTAESQMGKIEDILNKWEGKSADAAKAAMKSRAEYDAGRSIEQRLKKPQLTSADKEIGRAVRRILRNDYNKSPDELVAEAEQTILQIMSTPDGRLPKDEPGHVIQAPRANDVGDVRGSLNARKLPMPDNDLLPFLVRNPADYTLRYLRQAFSDLGMIARFGDTDGTVALKEIADEYANKMRAATSDAERLKLQQAMDADIRDFAAIRDRIKGTYGFSEDAFLQKAGRISESLKDFSVATLAGGFGLAQFPDFAGVVFRYGFGSALRDAWLPFLGRLKNLKKGGLRAVAGEWSSIGIGADSFIQSRAMDQMDVHDIYHHKTPFERGLRMTGRAVAQMSGMTLATDVQKIMMASASSNNILRFAEAVVDGTATRKQISALAAANIDADMARRITDSFRKAGGGSVVDDAMMPNLESWADLEAARRFKAAVLREVEIGVLTPGQEKPLFLSSPIVSMLGQFKTFIASATTRILLANMQRRDATTLSGLIASVSLGMMSYAAYTVAKGGALHDRPQDWIKEGIDKSGVIGWFGEVNNMAAKATGGRADIYRLIGADKPVSRYVSRGLLGNLLGPTFGIAERATGLIYAASNGEWSESDTTKLRQLTPFQNLFYIRRLFDEVEKGTNNFFGVEPKRQANDK